MWLGLIGIICLVTGLLADGHGLISRSMSAPDLGLAMLGTLLTMVLGAIAAFQLSTPDQSSRWALLPLPGLLLWIGASGFGCLRTWVPGGLAEISIAESQECFRFILLVSIPLSALTIFMLRRAFTLHPNLTAFTGGMAVAAAAALLLNFFHPFDASATDIAIHFAGVALVVGINQLASRFLPGSAAIRSATTLGSR